MRLRLTYADESAKHDVAVDINPNTTVGDVARSLANHGMHRSPTLSVETPSGSVRLDAALHAASAIGSGATVHVADTTDTEIPSGFSLVIETQDAMPATVPLRRGAHKIGRDPGCDIVVADATVSAVHATLIVGQTVEIVDEHSTNGLLRDGLVVPRATLDAGESVSLGDVVLHLEGGLTRSGEPAQIAPVKFNRSPRVQPSGDGAEFQAPEVPEPVRPQRMPYITALLPLVMGGVLFAVTRHASSLLFVVMSPLMAVGTFLQGRYTAKAEFNLAVKNFHELLSDLVQRITEEQDRERAIRHAECPPLSGLVDAVEQRGNLVWSRRPDAPGFLSIRIGEGREPSRSRIEYTPRPKGVAALQRELQETLAPLHTIDDVPVVCALPERGPLGIAGPARTRDKVARAFVAQISALHAPGEVCFAVLCPPSRTEVWDWVKWLPHVSNDLHPLNERTLIGNAGLSAVVIDELLQVIADRGQRDAVRLPALVLLVEDDAPARRSDLVQIAERGRDVGIHVIWLGEEVASLPAACRTFLACENAHEPSVGRVTEGEFVSPVKLELLDGVSAERFARTLAPLEDANLPSEAAGDVPTSVSFLAELGQDLATETDGVIRRWEESGSLMDGTSAARRASSLRAFVGRSAQDAVYLDLKSQGPHALVGGTTGAGKSEFLQAWILGMATSHSPRRVNFLFVDYKGGSAFAECVELPHSVGLVTDLSPHLVQRALVSLKAELRYREHIMNAKSVKDLAELERSGDPDAPPSLVIVVDEFAALVQEVPEFVDGMVSIAQLGRSLGLHLILATQRPSGVIRGNLRANTNLRVALRMADAEDSNDVIGSTLAATFAVDTPGRAAAKSGPGRLTVFQAAYAGGRAGSANASAQVQVADFGFGSARIWDPPLLGSNSHEVEDDRAESSRIVQTIRTAAESLNLPQPRKPWLPELEATVDLSFLIQAADSPTTLPFAMADIPEEQVQRPVGFRPDSDGALAVFGTGGTGKSTVLRSLAAACGLSRQTGPWHVYGIDFGSRGLSMLEQLPHVGAIISGDDTERTLRLFRQIRAEVDQRALRYSTVNAGSISDYRTASGADQEPRILLLIDGFSAMRSAYEVGPESWVLEALNSFITDGRALGIHVVLTADRPTALPGALQSIIQQRLFLRLANDNDVMAAGKAIPRDGFDSSTPAGRGFMSGQEIHVGTLDAAPDAGAQAEALGALAAALKATGCPQAPSVRRLPEQVSLNELPIRVGEDPCIGIRDFDLEPFGLATGGLFLIGGPAGSGRRSAALAVIQAWERSRGGVRAAYLGSQRSHLCAAWPWTWTAADASAVAEAAQHLSSGLHADPTVADIVVIDAVGELINSVADMPLQDLVRSCRASGCMVVAVGETNELAGSWPLLQLLRADRRGLLLQPETADGEAVLRTALPRVNRRDFPLGRGMFVSGGRAVKVQMAMPMPSEMRTSQGLPEPSQGG